MEKTFMIIDDDISIRKILGILIRRNITGRVVAELESGRDAVDEILFYNPDIVLIDLLLPFASGIEIVAGCMKSGFKGKFIMISQVEEAEMIAKAYEGGIVFFISKPINTVEVINIIKGVCRNIDLEKSLEMIKSTLLNIGSIDILQSMSSMDDQLTKIFTDIGIIGVTGSSDLRRVIHKIIEVRQKRFTGDYQLQDIYDSISAENGSVDGTVNRKTLEQRIRRIVQKALETIVHLGLDDYTNDIFTTYNTTLFDFRSVRQEMLHIKNPNEEPGKINIKKFIEGIISMLK